VVTVLLFKIPTIHIFFFKLFNLKLPSVKKNFVSSKEKSLNAVPRDSDTDNLVGIANNLMTQRFKVM